jgi:hypothetical protein
MPFNRTSLPASLALAAFVTLLGACGPAGVNGSVDVPAGGSADSATTVNGAVHVGDGATVGKAATVNGAIHLGQNVTAGSAKTVNGGIRVGSGAKVTDDVIVVNGGIDLAKGAEVAGRVTNVNGNIRLDAARVGGGITTFNGDIRVGSGSRVEGGIHVEKPEGSGDWIHNVPRIVIEGGAVVEGPLKFEREVRLYVSESAEIGPVEGATVEKYMGEEPDGDVGSSSGDAHPEPSAAAGTGGGPERE